MITCQLRDAADSLSEILRLMGMDARTAYNGADALELLPSYRPHAAVLDLGMPGMDGYELARRMRAAASHAQLLIAAMTGYGNERDRERTAASGFDMHLVKPVEFTALQTLAESARTRVPA